jgi:MFS family permease
MTVPLYKNRNYTILWSSRFVSEIAGEIAYLAFPLIILSTSGSPWELGAVASVYGAAQIVGVIPAGYLADRVSRKTMMAVIEGLRLVVLASFGALLLTGQASFGVMLLAAGLEGALGAAFAPAEDSALPNVVESSQLVTALARNTSRTYLAALLGPAASGALFALHAVLPFAVDVAALGASLIALAFLRLPRGVLPAAEEGEEVLDESGGMLWALKHPGLRATLLWIGFSQLFTTALVILVLGAAGDHGASPGSVGLMMTCYGAGGLLGSAAAEHLHRVLRPPTVIIGFSWLLVALIAAMAFASPGWPLGILLGLVAFFVPTAFTTIMGYQLAVTPDGSRGRLSALVGVTAGLATTVGPLLGAALLAAGTSVSPFIASAVGLAVVAGATTASPAIRRIARPDDIPSDDQAHRLTPSTR